MLDPAILTLPDNELVIEVGSRLWSASDSNPESLSQEELVILCVYVLEAEVNNGGFHQFFLNSSGDYALETPGALDMIGASTAARIVREALAEFGSAGPNPDREARITELEAFGEGAIHRWDRLDQEFYEYPDDLGALLATFIRNHSDAIHQIEAAKPDA